MSLTGCSRPSVSQAVEHRVHRTLVSVPVSRTGLVSESHHVLVWHEGEAVRAASDDHGQAVGYEETSGATLGGRNPLSVADEAQPALEAQGWHIDRFVRPPQLGESGVVLDGVRGDDIVHIWLSDRGLANVSVRACLHGVFRAVGTGPGPSPPIPPPYDKQAPVLLTCRA